MISQAQKIKIYLFCVICRTIATIMAIFRIWKIPQSVWESVLESGLRQWHAPFTSSSLQHAFHTCTNGNAQILDSMFMHYVVCL